MVNGASSEFPESIQCTPYQGFLAFGLAEDVAKGLPLENPEGGLQYSSEGVH